jgi:hypothetical protein
VRTTSKNWGALPERQLKPNFTWLLLLKSKDEITLSANASYIVVLVNSCTVCITYFFLIHVSRAEAILLFSEL